MARLLSWPTGLIPVAYQPLTGPRAVGSASTESVTGRVQTTASAFGAWRWQMTLRPMRKNLLRRYRGLVVGLHGGANATRVPFCDFDIMSWEDSGVDTTPAEVRAGVPWSNGASWENGANWQVSRPWAHIAAAVKGDTIIQLGPQYWGEELQPGDFIGIVPFHFGMYCITDVIVPGRYRIWPPLRKATVTTDRATLSPVMAMRLESEAAATLSRGRVTAEGNTMTMVEVMDEDVREYFAD